MVNYKKGTPEYKAYKQGKKKQKPGFDFNQLAASGGLGVAGLLISSIMGDKKKK